MTEPPKIVAVIDAFMQSEKLLVGADQQQNWQDGREHGEKKLKLPLELGGEQSGQSLIVMAYPRHEPLMFRILIAFEPAVCRLDFSQHEKHGNPLDCAVDGIPGMVIGAHCHPWSLNKRFFTGVTQAVKLHCAIPFAPQIKKFDSALRWFCDENNVRLPNGKHVIELPTKDTLI